MHSSIAGWIPAGTGTNQYFVRGNSVYLPWIGGNWANALPAIATTNPQGYASLVNADIYQKWRVISSRIKIQLQPEAAVDNVICSVTPTFLAAQPATVEKALAHEFSRSANISMSQPTGSQTIVNKITTHRLLGVRKQALLDDLSGQYIGATAATPLLTWSWLINFDTSDKTVTINRLAYRVDMEYDVELFGDSAGADFPFAETGGYQLPAPDRAVPDSSAELLKKYTAARVLELAALPK